MVGTLCSLTKAAILCRNWNRISSHAALGIAGLDVALARLVILRRLYTEFTNDLTSKSRYCPYVSKSALISPINIPRIVVELITAPDILKLKMFYITLHLIPLGA